MRFAFFGEGIFMPTVLRASILCIVLLRGFHNLVPHLVPLPQEEAKVGSGGERRPQSSTVSRLRGRPLCPHTGSWALHAGSWTPLCGTRRSTRPYKSFALALSTQHLTSLPDALIVAEPNPCLPHQS